MPFSKAFAQTDAATVSEVERSSSDLTIASDVPDDLSEVASSIQTTVLSVWSDFVGHIPFLISGLIVILATWGVSKIVERVMRRWLLRESMRRSLRDLLVRLVGIGVWSAGLMLTAMVVFPGLTPARALGALGLVSIAVGFAFKDIFENFFAGILMLWRFPFEPGDYIECQGIVGQVEDVTVRMTVIRKTTGELVVMPNSQLFKNPVEILTHQNKRRVTMMTGVAYGEDVAEAVGVVEKAVKQCETVDAERPIQVFPQAFGSSSIDIEVAWWTDSKPVGMRRSRGEVVTAVKKALDDAGIEIPFPYRTLTFKEPLDIRGGAD